MAQDADADTLAAHDGQDAADLAAEKKPAPVIAPYSSFSKPAKWRLLAMVSVAAFFSPISSNILLPAIDDISRSLGHSIEQINLSLTVYLIFQAVTPAFWGSLADVYGRRIVCLATMAVFIASCIGES